MSAEIHVHGEAERLEALSIDDLYELLGTALAGVDRAIESLDVESMSLTLLVAALAFLVSAETPAIATFKAHAARRVRRLAPERADRLLKGLV